MKALCALVLGSGREEGVVAGQGGQGAGSPSQRGPPMLLRQCRAGLSRNTSPGVATSVK